MAESVEHQSLEKARTREATADDGQTPALRVVTTEQPNYPTGIKLATIMGSLYLSVFLIALDRTIIATAIPRITDTFNSINDIGWYGAAYLLTNCGFILTFGRVYTYYSTKWVFLSGIILFEVGSAICGAAPNSVALIIGRAIAGFGGSGMFTGAILIIVASLPLSRRALFQGMFGAVFGVASVAGPLMGGAFTDSSATWRWCFYINLPIGGVTLILLFFFLHLDEKKREASTWMEQFKSLDPLGLLCFLPGIVCLLLALQWGGVVYAFNNWRIILLFVLFGVLIIGFIIIQGFTRNTTATIPARILANRNVTFACYYTFCVGSVMMMSTYYIPIWFQAIQGVSAVESGIRTLPQILSVVVGSITGGAVVQRVGYYLPFMVVGPIIMSIGAGLITTWNVNTTTGEWIGYQILLGLGIGICFQQPNLAAQRVLKGRDVPTGTSLVFFFQALGGAVFLAVAQNVFLSKLVQRVMVVAPDVNVGLITESGATRLRGNIPANSLGEVLEAYNYGLTRGPFLVTVVMACLTILGVTGMEWLSLNDKPGSTRAEAREHRVKMKAAKAQETDVEKAEEAISRTVDVQPLPVADPTASYVVQDRNKEVDVGETHRPESVEGTESNASVSDKARL